jgi:secreted trypsin-like serine protease
LIVFNVYQIKWKRTLWQKFIQIKSDCKNLKLIKGDSGGPLNFWNDKEESWFVAGLTSFGFNCGHGGVFTKTSFFYEWMLSVC